MKNELPLVNKQQNMALQLPFIILREKFPNLKEAGVWGWRMLIARKCSISPMIESKTDQWRLRDIYKHEVTLSPTKNCKI